MLREIQLTACCAALMLLSAWQVQAATYRCEIKSSQPGGKTEIRYQGQVCEGGRALQVADQRTAAQRADTTRATQVTAQLGQQLARERRHQEKKSAGQPPIAMDAPKPKAKPAENLTLGPTLKRHRPFTAKVPKAPVGSGQALK